MLDGILARRSFVPADAGARRVDDGQQPLVPLGAFGALLAQFPVFAFLVGAQPDRRLAARLVLEFRRDIARQQPDGVGAGIAFVLGDDAQLEFRGVSVSPVPQADRDDLQHGDRVAGSEAPRGHATRVGA